MGARRDRGWRSRAGRGGAWAAALMVAWLLGSGLGLVERGRCGSGVALAARASRPAGKAARGKGAVAKPGRAPAAEDAAGAAESSIGAGAAAAGTAAALAPQGSAAAPTADAGASVAKPVIPADAPTAVARVDRNEAAIGDRITLTVTTVAPVGVPTNLPTELDLGPFEAIGGDPVIEEKDLGDGHRSRSFRIEIAAYQTGALEVPPIAVTYIGKDGRVLSRPTDPVPVKITSLIANEPDPQLKDAAAPVAVLEPDLTLVYVGAGLGVAALGAFIALELRRRWRLRDARRPAPPPRPAHEIALEKLGQLATSGLGSDSDLRQFYFQLSEIVREYLGGRFDFPALEMTTQELSDELARLGPRGLVPGEIAGWLSGCDLVKFAKLAPPPAEARGALETAIRMVESTRPRFEPPVAGAAVTEGEAHGH
jgi:hypothetical protein